MHNNTTWQPSVACNLLACWLLFCGTGAVAAGTGMPAALRVLPVDGPSWEGRLLSITPAGQIVFDCGGERRKLAWDDLVEWGAPVAAWRGAMVVTTGGSRLVGDVLEMKNDQLTLRCRSAGRLIVPMTHVRGVLFVLPLDRAVRDRLITRIERDARDSDQLLLANGDLLRGTLMGLDRRLLRVETAGDTLSIRRDRVVAFLADPAVLIESSDRSKARTLMGMRDGGLWQIGLRSTDSNSEADDAIGEASVRERMPGKYDLEITDGHTHARLIDGIAVTDFPVDEVVFLQPATARLVYLSDLSPATTVCQPYLQLAWPVSDDHAAHGGLLRAGGRLYFEGLGMHSASSVTYRIDGSFDRFDAEVAVDQRAGRRGSVVFRVMLYRSGKWHQAAATDVVRGGQPLRSLSADINHATAIRLEVGVADHGDEGDFADWLLARLVRPQTRDP